MLKLDKVRIIMVKPPLSVGNFVLPDGGRAVVMDRHVHERALHAADELFAQAIRQMKVRGDGR